MTLQNDAIQAFDCLIKGKIRFLVYPLLLRSIRRRGEDDASGHRRDDDENEQKDTVANQGHLFPFELNCFTPILITQTRFVAFDGV